MDISFSLASKRMEEGEGVDYYKLSGTSIEYNGRSWNNVPRFNNVSSNFSIKLDEMLSILAIDLPAKFREIYKWSSLRKKCLAKWFQASKKYEYLREGLPNW